MISTLYQLIGSVLSVGLEGPELNSEEALFLKDYQPAGWTVFRRNIRADTQGHPDLTQLASLIKSTQNTIFPRIISVDQEGGRVSRLRGSVEIPDLGAAYSLFSELGEEQKRISLQSYGRNLGVSLSELGIHLNFAPVCDTLTNPLNIAIGDRCFADTFDLAAGRASAFLKGLHQSKVWGCLKHFPGQGGAPTDTHQTTSRITKNREDLLREEVDVFKRVLESIDTQTQNKQPLVMMSHCIYTQLDDLPASQSRVIMKDLLVNKLKFKGIIVSDDLMMGAITGTNFDAEFDGELLDSWLTSLERTLDAGCDLLLICRNVQYAKIACHHLAKKAALDPIFLQKIEKKSDKILSFRKHLF